MNERNSAMTARPRPGKAVTALMRAGERQTESSPGDNTALKAERLSGDGIRVGQADAAAALLDRANRPSEKPGGVTRRVGAPHRDRRMM